jgi:hypothetical protein
MRTSRTTHRLAATVLATLAAVAGGTALAQSAAAAEPPTDPVDRAVLDFAQVVWPMPEDYEYEFTVQERIEGFLGLNSFPGGPFGEFPQPASETDPEMMPGSPGVGYIGTVSELTGINPRPAADETEQGREMYGGGEPVAPACDDPEGCDALLAGGAIAGGQR